MEVLKAIAGFLAILLFCFQLSVLFTRVVRQSEPFEAKTLHTGYLMVLIGAFIVVFFTPPLGAVVSLLVFVVLIGCLNLLIVHRYQSGRNIRSVGVGNMVVVFLALVLCVGNVPGLVDLVS